LITELIFVRNAVKASRSGQVDLIVASNLKTAAAATVIRFLGGPGWIWYIHDYLDRRGLLRRIAARFFFTTCSGWIAVSLDLAAVTQRLAGRNATGAMIYSWVRRDVEPEPKGGPPVRAPMDEAVLFVGSINSWKGLRCLVEGMGFVKAACGTAPRIDVAGQVVDKEYWADVQAFAVQHGLELRYLGRRDDVPQLMRQYAVLIHPTPAAEPFGLVVAEAILAGCFVISSAQGGVREMLPKEMIECGFDPNKPSSLVAAFGAAREAQVRYGAQRDAVITALAAMTSEKAYTRGLRNFFQKVVPQSAML